MLSIRIKRLLSGPQWGISLLILARAVAADYYIYKENDGTSWYTDRHLPSHQYTLIATVGRPTASASCIGVTQATLERRATMHLPVIERYASTYGVDARLIKAIISVESCFDRYAVSPVGAKGLMQLMPATAEQMGVRNVFDANDNMHGGVRYFSEMLSRFKHNVEFALAAYNAGPTAVEKYKGVPPFEETQKYVKRVLGYYDRYAALQP